jgi:1-acyl-sn-glycerol-3-phosphate acyltransferase
MIRRARAVWRLARVVGHGLHGLVIVLTRFPHLEAASRHAHIRWFARKLLRALGIEVRVEGEPHPGGVLLVANHISWLDITALHAVVPQARFVSKADVKAWPLLSRLVHAADTLFLERERKRDALRVVHEMARALSTGHTVAVFPEGTTSDGHTLLPFHANLLQAAITTEAPVQAVALRFSDAAASVSAAVEFVGDTTLAQSLWRVACGEKLVAHIALLPSRASASYERRALAEALRADIAERLAI